MTTDDLKRYKTILELTNAQMQGYEPGGTCRHRADPNSGTLFQSCFLRRGGIAELSFHYGITGRGTDMAGKLYFDLITPQFVSHTKVRCLRAYIPPTAFCNKVIDPTTFCNEVFENLY